MCHDTLMAECGSKRPKDCARPPRRIPEAFGSAMLIVPGRKQTRRPSQDTTLERSAVVVGLCVHSGAEFCFRSRLFMARATIRLQTRVFCWFYSGNIYGKPFSIPVPTNYFSHPPPQFRIAVMCFYPNSRTVMNTPFVVFRRLI